MKNSIIILLLSILLLLGINCRAQSNNSSAPRVEIAGTQLLRIHSSIVNQDYDLYINIPRFFDDTSRTFPVIYLLDAQWDFTLLNAIYGEQYYDGFLPEAITVGITWGGINPNPDILRSRDFTPTKTMQSPISGGAEKFLLFINKELIPFIDSTFRTKPGDRTLMGSSLGGLFTLYTLFNEARLFNRYVLTSPAIRWNNGIISTYEKKYSEGGSDIPVKLSMAIGGYEDVNSFQSFVDNLKEKKYKGLDLNTFVIDGIGHSGAKAEGYTRGLQFVFKRTPVDIRTNILEKYTGTYHAAQGFKVNVRLDDNHLVAEIPGAGDVILYALNENEFYVIGLYLKVNFQINENGNTTGFEAESYSNKFTMKKIN